MSVVSSGLAVGDDLVAAVVGDFEVGGEEVDFLHIMASKHQVPYLGRYY